MNRCTGSMRICRGVGRRALGVGSALALSACAHVGTPGPVVADRPGYTDTPVALPAGAIQLEMGVTSDQTGPVGARTTTLSAGELLVRAGIGSSAELRLFGNSYDVRSASNTATARGVEDVKVGAKLNLRAVPDSVHSAVPNIALVAASTLPTGGAAITAGAAQAEVKLAANWTTPSPFSLYTNVGYTSGYATLAQAGRAWTSVAGWWALNPRISLFGEGVYFNEFTRNFAQGSSVADVGATYLVNDRFQVDVRLGHGTGGTSSDERFVGVGLARRW